MMINVWGKIHAISEFDTHFGDNCGPFKPYGDAVHSYGKIALKTSEDGKTWSNVSFLPLGPLAFARDPSILYVPKTDSLCVFFNGAEKRHKDYKGPPQRQCKTRNGGWEQPVPLTPGLDAECAGFIEGRPVGVALPSGRLLISTWRGYFGSDLNDDMACIIKSDDNGKSWSRAALLTKASESAMVLLPNNTVYLNARHSNSHDAVKGRVTGYSLDGEKWDIEYNSKHSPPDTRSPSPTSMVRVNGTILMALPTEDPHKALTVFASFDGGLSWPWSQFVDPDDCYHPSLTTFPDDPEHVGVAWESSAKNPGNCTGSCAVRFARVKIPQGPRASLPKPILV